MVSLAVASLMILACSMTAFAVLRGSNRVDRAAEDWAVFDNVRRVTVEDVHAAKSASASAASLVLREFDGSVFTYYVNADHQLVRVKTGGGTAVIATSVNAFSASLRSAPVGWVLTILVKSTDGASLSWDVGSGG